MTAPVYVVLLHYPATNRKGEVVATAVTNLDIHDIARSARTYGARGYFIVTPILDQHRMVERILEHWRGDLSKEWHPDRFEAVSRIRLVHSFEEVKKQIQNENGSEPEVILTDARPHANSISYRDLRAELENSDRTRPLVLVLGTGWGVSEVFHSEVDRVLDPIYGPEPDPNEAGYNHLSVRAAAAIILDRLFGR